MDNVSMNIDDDSYIDHLKEVRKEEQALVERLMGERLYLGEALRIDALTGLHNRKIFPKIRDIGTVVMCDIDDFKTVNDTFGHAMGDEVLRALGRTISDNIRIGDVGIRYGGDEFIIVFTTDKKEVIDSRMKKIAEDYNRAMHLPGYRLTLSIGVAFNTDKEKLEVLIRKADEAAYHSKQNGKDQITYYDQIGKQKIKERN